MTHQSTVRSRRCTTAVGNESGAVDLGSIMVGVLVIGIVGGIASAAVFAAVPWSQDRAAEAELGAAATSQAVAKMNDDTYLDLAGLHDLGYLPESESLAVYAGDECYVAVSASTTGKLFYSTNKSLVAKELNWRDAPLECDDVNQVARTVPAVAADPAKYGTPFTERVDERTGLGWAVTTSGDGRLMIVSSHAGTFRSTDSGATWTRGPVDVAWSLTSSEDMKTIIALDGTAQWRSTDSGLTWTYRTTTENIRNIEIDDAGIRAVSLDNNGNIRLSTDGGATWGSPDNLGLRYPYQPHSNSLALSGDGSTIYAVDVYSAFASDDFGKTWRTLGHPMPGEDQFMSTVSTSADGRKVVLAGDQYLRVSNDGGRTFKAVVDDLGRTFSWKASTMSARGDVIYVAENGGSSAMSPDGGRTWQFRKSNLTHVGFGMTTIRDGSVAWLASDGGLFKTTWNHSN